MKNYKIVYSGYAKFFIYIFLTFIYTASYSQHTIKNQNIILSKNSKSLFTDTSKYAIIESLSQIKSVFPKNYRPSILNKSEFEIMRNLVIRTIDSLNIGAKERWKIYTPIYKYQIIVVTNNKEQKVVWINAFCNDFNTNWRKNILFVNDGGICYFRLSINLTTMKFLSFSSNGIA